jgi:hypothetical protein
MTRIQPLQDDQASPEAKAALDVEVRLRGRLTNLKRIQAYSPAALRIYGEWFTLKDELNKGLSNKAVFVFSQAISEAQKSEIPIGFFRRALTASGFDPDNLVLTEQEALLEEFGFALGVDANAVPDALWQRLEAAFDTTALVNLVAFAGIMVATTVFANIVRAEPDEDLIAYLKPAT